MTANEIIELYSNKERYFIGIACVSGDLSGATLRDANFGESNLSKANLSGADLHGSSFVGTNLQNANLCGAILTKTWLATAGLSGADLTDTILDPTNKPNGGIGDWEERDGWTYGYRSKQQIYQDGPDYEVGKVYTAPVFSTCPETACHPGLYVSPSAEDAETHLVSWKSKGRLVVKVRFRREDLQSAGGKHRVKRFEVLEEIQR